MISIDFIIDTSGTVSLLYSGSHSNFILKVMSFGNEPACCVNTMFNQWTNVGIVYLTSQKTLLPGSSIL